MTVNELLEALKHAPGDAPVVMAYDAGSALQDVYYAGVARLKRDVETGEPGKVSPIGALYFRIGDDLNADEYEK